MTGTKVQLIQFSTFRAQGSKKQSTRVLYKQKRGQFQSSESWSRVPIQIPAVVPSNLPFCNHISVDYRIVVSILKKLNLALFIVIITLKTVYYQNWSICKKHCRPLEHYYWKHSSATILFGVQRTNGSSGGEPIG